MRKGEGQNESDEERETRARLALAITQILERRGLSQVEAARRLGVSQPKISALENQRLAGFSIERLMRFFECAGLRGRDCDSEQDG